MSLLVVFWKGFESDQRRLTLLVSNGCLSGASDATVTSQVRERQKSNRFRLAKQQLCTHIALFCTFFLSSLHVCDVKLPNFMFCRGRERKTKILFFFP